MTPLIQRVIEAINSFINKQASFTILEISNLVKTDGGPFASHQEVRAIAKPILDGLIAGRGYAVSPISVHTATGAPDTANLYHPVTTSALSYTATAQRAVTPGQVAVAAKVAAAVAPAPQASPAPVAKAAAPVAAPAHLKNAHIAKVVKPRSDGGIEIPQAMLDEVALEEVTIVNHPNSISIVAGDDRIVGISGFRLAKSTLAKSGLDTGAPLNVCVFSDKILISK